MPHKMKDVSLRKMPDDLAQICSFPLQIDSLREHSRQDLRFLLSLRQRQITLPFKCGSSGRGHQSHLRTALIGNSRWVKESRRTHKLVGIAEIHSFSRRERCPCDAIQRVICLHKQRAFSAEILLYGTEQLLIEVGPNPARLCKRGKRIRA